MKPAKRKSRALHFGQALRDAMQIVDERWTDIEKLATALMNGGKFWKLEGDQIATLLPQRT